MNTIAKSTKAELSAYFDKHSVNPEDGVLVAFSGGSDSLGLLYALSFLVPAGRLHAAYVNHRLRSDEELSREVEINRHNCDMLGVPFSVLDLGRDEIKKVALQRGMGTEDAARTLRYQVLESKRRYLGFSYIATAHTADDQLETLLMRMLQGGALTSLRGISAKRGALIRPALRLTREGLRAELTAAGLVWVEDSTNAQDAYLRNRIRHAIVPSVLSVFPSARNTACSFAEKASAAVDCLELAAASVDRYLSPDGEDRVTADIRAISALPEYLRLAAVYRMWGMLQGDGLVKLSHEMACRVASMFSDGDIDGENIVISGCKTIVEIVSGKLVWRKALPGGSFSYAVPVDLSETTSAVSLPGGYELKRTEAVESLLAEAPLDLYIPENRIEFPLIVRTWRDGDSIELAGGTTLVSKLIGQWKLPVGAANDIPVLEDRTGLVAVMGKAWGGKDRLARRFKVSPLARIGLSHYSVLKRNECSE